MPAVKNMASAATRSRRPASLLLRWFVAIVAVAGVCSHVAIYASRPELTPISSDGFDYYVYLPDWFLFHETSLQAVADDCCGGRFPDWTAMTRSPRTGRWVNPHPIGVAVLTAPFFGLAHALTRWSGLPPDGFSLYYQHAAALAGLCFMLAGLWVLRALLRRHTSDGVALATLAALTFGTNLFHYGVFDATYSHAFSFALVCALMALTEGWWEEPELARTLGLGVVAGLLVLVRHPNVLFLSVVPLFGLAVSPPAGGGGRARLVRLRTSTRNDGHDRRSPSVAADARSARSPEGTRMSAHVCIEGLRWHVLAIAVLAALIVTPQLVLYRAAAGGWFVNPYAAAGGSFAFLSSPRIGGVLFSIKKGLFFWSPVLLFALPGFASSLAWAGRWRAAAIGMLAIHTYLIASWHDWQFGGSYGHRGFTDVLGLFAPFLAATFSWAGARGRSTRTAIGILAGLAVMLSVLQMTQYWLGLLPIADTTFEQYKAMWGHILR